MELTAKNAENAENAKKEGIDNKGTRDTKLENFATRNLNSAILLYALCG
jgi:hypothetical protein